jgi:hypothetical protein
VEMVDLPGMLNILLPNLYHALTIKLILAPA